MTSRPIRKFFAVTISVGLFFCLAWVFGIFMQPQGGVGAIFALVLIGFCALGALWVHGWIMKPGPKMRFRNRGIDGYDRDWGVGMTGYAEHQRGGRRRRDDDSADDPGNRRSSDAGDMDEAGDDGDGIGDGSLA